MNEICFSASIILLTWQICLNSCHSNSTNTTSPPNIILINIDDMGWRDVGFMGTEYYRTPHIDELARSGMIFTNGYAAAANCAPSRASIMTGKWSTRHGIYTVSSSERGASKDRKIIPTKNTLTLSQEHHIIPQYLSPLGYTNCHAGKWHLSDDPLEYGFDHNIGGAHNGAPASYYPPYRNVDIDHDHLEYLTDVIMDKTVSFIDTVQGPFFLNYAPYAVHTPIQPVEDLLLHYDQKPSWHDQNNPKYATMIENLDRNIGLMLAKLRERNLMQNTFIIFTSDNGGLDGITDQTPLRAGKGSYYEGGIRVPFAFIWNGRIQSGITSDQPITHLDLFPTILSAAGVSLSELEYDGSSLMDILDQKTAELDRTLFWHFPIYLQSYTKKDEMRDTLFRTRPGSVILQDGWKLHYYFEDNEVELFDLNTDVGEQKDLSLIEQAKKEELLALLEEWWQITEAPIPTTPNPDYIDPK